MKHLLTKRHWQLFLLLLMGISFASSAATLSDGNPKYKLLVWDNNGLSTSFELEYGATITFSEGQMVITNDVADVIPFDMDNTWKLTYEPVDGPGSGLESLSADYNSVVFNGEDIIFRNLKSGSNVSVYSVNGILIMNKTIAYDGDFSFGLSNQSQGVYIVSVNGKTYKIVKK